MTGEPPTILHNAQELKMLGRGAILRAADNTGNHWTVIGKDAHGWPILAPCLLATDHTAWVLTDLPRPDAVDPPLRRPADR